MAGSKTLASTGSRAPSGRAKQEGDTAWGKVILLGEHAVVYGHKAIAGAIHLGLTCTAKPAEHSRLTVSAWKIDIRAGDEHPVAKAYDALLAKSESKPLHIEVDAFLPAAAGLGSSAALCVALARALKPGISGTALHQLANYGEQFFHERPSGIDVALSADGGIGLYTKADGLTPLACPGLPLVIGLSGQARSTAKMVEGVAERRASNPKIDESLQAIAELSVAGIDALLAGDMEAVGHKMTQNHQLLRDIGVSIDILDQMVETALQAGALGAKLTGAGGGGAMIALAPGRQEEVAQALRALGYEAFVTTLGAQS